jgi:DNA end-binding protein Ku
VAAVPRPSWKGALSFGLVSVNVGLYSAVTDHDIGFKQIDRKTQKRVRYRKVAEGTDDEVTADRIVKGYELQPGQYVLIEPDDLAKIQPAKSGTIEIHDFVDIAQIDPIYFDTSYYLAPEKGADKPYRLLRDAMAQSGRVGIAEFVMRNRQYLAAVRADDNALVLTTLHFADEIRDVAETLGEAPPEAAFKGRELDLAKSLIEQMTVDWEPTQYRDTYRDRVEELVRAKAEGSEIAVSGEEPKAPVLDLMEALRRSVAGEDGDTGSTKKGKGKKKASAPADDDRTVDELRDEAKRLKVPGRSKMNRDELLEAIHGASAAAS